MSPEDSTPLIFNSLLHSLILFSILSALYIFVIVKMIENGFRNQIYSAVQKGINPVMGDLDEVDKERLKRLPFDRLRALFGRPSPEIKVYNDWLTKVIIGIILVLAITFILGVSLLYFTCGQTIPILHIVAENIVVFAFVGSFEFIFFTYIASRYAPIKPSLLSQTFYTELKKVWN